MKEKAATIQTDAPYALHWFRRDLRVKGNVALNHARDEYSGRVLGVFFFDEKFLSRPDFSHRRFAFFIKTLRALKAELQERGGDLLVLDQGPEAGFESLLERIQKAGSALPKKVYFNRDYEPFARRRDQKITDFLEKRLHVSIETHRDHLILEPGECGRGEGEFYKVYSPFARRWFERLRSPEVRERIESASTESKRKFCLAWADVLGKRYAELDRLEIFENENSAHVDIPIPEAGERAARKALASFRGRILDYAKNRDYPELEGTSKLSIFFKNGSLSTAQAIETLDLSTHRFTDTSGMAIYLKELCWREFYYHVLYRWPEVEKESFIEKYRAIEWENNRSQFEAWKEGQTGYPIVDAGMRELKETGLMHNRVRMIVASFLTKHLLIDWRWGEKYFMQMLLDGDIAANNGGWQWAASTGCDPQPYFRIFNPTLQSKKFDANGTYIRKYVPELRMLSAKQIHAPSDATRPKSYPVPIVQHETARIRALRRYQ